MRAERGGLGDLERAARLTAQRVAVRATAASSPRSRTSARTYVPFEQRTVSVARPRVSS